MSTVRSSVLRVVARVASSAEEPEALLASVGLAPAADPLEASRESVDEEAYYAFLERAVAPGDDGLPYRYGAALHPDDFSALGLALKTAPTLRDSLRRLVRYVLLLSDTLEYELRDDPGGAATLVLLRPHHRRGARLANECALAAVVSVLREAAGRRIAPVAVAFCHGRPDSVAEAHAWFGRPVEYDARANALTFDAATLDTPAKLADAGLSSFLLAHLEGLRAERADRSLVSSVRATVTDLLPDGLPKKVVIARRLGMSERTLHRRLADQGETFQEIVRRARQEAAETLLSDDRHTLAEVAFLTGFADQSAFQRAFKTWTGRTPLGFRAAYHDAAPHLL
ncbi:AraC family transcriptional regulator [Nocardioides sp. YIM 152588]|uniref:AraC family transcriptional regulator n=1 Tax=Nocardioides sp. YIM 152588 TaxID=3158259 RepID=UPI0032E3C471